MKVVAYAVRFKGHLTVGVRTGFARKPILIRARRGEDCFRVEVNHNLVDLERDGQQRRNDDIFADIAKIEKVARMECARAIKRTNEARRRLCLLVAHSTLAGESLPKIKSAARIMADTKTKAPTRRGKIWKIVPIGDLIPRSLTLAGSYGSTTNAKA